MPEKSGAEIFDTHPSMNPRYLPILLILTLDSTPAIAQDATKIDPRVAQLEKEYVSALQNAKMDLGTLENRYVEELTKLKTEVETAGDLKVALLIQDEIQNYASPKTRDFTVSPRLQRLREIYQEGARRLEPEVLQKRKAVMTDYAQRFEQLKLSLTQESNLRAAQQAEQQADAIRLALQAGDIAAPGATAKALWTLTGKRDVKIVKDCELDRKGDQFILTSRHRDGSYLNTDQSFELPIRISARAGTDTTNIRFYFGDIPLAIFNWEEKPDQLRIHHPINRSARGFNGVGHLARNQLYDLVIDLEKEKITVSIDGKQSAQLTGDFSGASGPVGLGPAFGSVITVERFEVFKIVESAKATP